MTADPCNGRILRDRGSPQVVRPYHNVIAHKENPVAAACQVFLAGIFPLVHTLLPAILGIGSDRSRSWGYGFWRALNA